MNSFKKILLQPTTSDGPSKRFEIFKPLEMRTYFHDENLQK